MITTISPSRGLLLAALLSAGLVVGATAAPARAHATHTASATVKTAKNPTLHKTLLVTAKGLTLYSLSAERKGKFICTDKACLSLWTPLLAPRSAPLTGVSGLGTVKRPGGRLQVAFRGAPLYTFNDDRKPGEVKGNGFKDVGTWLATSPTPKPASTVTTPPTGGNGGGYGY
jgi:predicted lipoprotein with Yx(FWY)xxD motif